MRRLIPDPFIAALFGAVLLASLLPARGGWAPLVDGVATGAIVLLFFLHGLRLPREAVVEGVRHWRLHLTILAATFLLFPLLGIAAAALLPGLLPPALWTGVLFLCVLPSTVQSSIAFTSIAGGNVAGAVAAATASNMIGIALTPLLAGLVTQVQGGNVPLSGVGAIVLELLLPFAAGHLLRPWLGAAAGRHRSLLALVDRTTILLAVYSAFSAAVVQGIWHQVTAGTLVRLILFCCLLLAAVLLATRWGSRLLGFSREDEIAIVFCGSKKTLASGIPMARVLFPAAQVGPVLLPIMIFHQIQLMVCAWLARRYARATPAEPRRREG